jgi:hypothetical protein
MRTMSAAGAVALLCLAVGVPEPALAQSSSGAAAAPAPAAAVASHVDSVDPDGWTCNYYGSSRFDPMTGASEGFAAKPCVLRDGWGARIRLWLKWDDTGGFVPAVPSECVTARYILRVDGGPDQAEQLLQGCIGPGEETSLTGDIGAGAVGLGIDAVSLDFTASGEFEWPPLSDPVFVGLPQMPEQGSLPRLGTVGSLLRMPLAKFLAQKATHKPAWIDWSDDGCSAPIAKAVRPLFRKACIRHDFGYRNYGSTKRLAPTDDRRKTVDDFLLADARKICSTKFADDAVLRAGCRTQAESMYQALRYEGARTFYP